VRSRVARLLRSLASKLDPPCSIGVQAGYGYAQTIIDAERIAAIANQQIELALRAATDGYDGL
jgi:hypothetical protein